MRKFWWNFYRILHSESELNKEKVLVTFLKYFILYLVPPKLVGASCCGHVFHQQEVRNKSVLQLRKLNQVGFKKGIT